MHPKDEEHPPYEWVAEAWEAHWWVRVLWALALVGWAVGPLIWHILEC